MSSRRCQWYECQNLITYRDTTLFGYIVFELHRYSCTYLHFLFHIMTNLLHPHQIGSIHTSKLLHVFFSMIWCGAISHEYKVIHATLEEVIGGHRAQFYAIRGIIIIRGHLCRPRM